MRFLILVLLLLAGCATTAGYEKVLNTWVGQSADRLISSWGAPANSTQLSNGGRVLEYSNQRNVQVGGYTTTVPQTTYQTGTTNVYGSNGGSAYGNYNGTSTTYVQRTTPVQNITMQCVTRFTVNAQGTITNWAWQGNDCKAKEPPQQDAEQRTGKLAELREAFKKMDAQGKAICDKPEYAPLFLKSPCSSKDISLAHLADSSKITQEQKDILLRFRSEIDAHNKARNEFGRSDGFELDRQWADYLDSIQSEIDKYNLDLYKGDITWGEYNQLRKNLTAKIAAKGREIYPQAK
jgi:hypothetical protein